MFKLHDERSAVRRIQTYLYFIKYRTYPSLPHLSIDGIYGEGTRAAVSAYQRLRGLPASGIADAVTFRALYEDYERAALALSANALIPPDTPLPVSVGYRGVGIRNLQNCWCP